MSVSVCVRVRVCVCVCSRACVCVCACVCPSVIISRSTCPIFTYFFVHVTYGRGSVFLWWHSEILHISGFVYDVVFAHRLIGCSTLPPGWGSEAHMYAALSLACRIPVAGSRCSGLLLAVRAYLATVGMLNMYDIMLALCLRFKPCTWLLCMLSSVCMHVCVSMCIIVTRKWRVLRVTPSQMTTQGLESAVYDCLV